MKRILILGGVVLGLFLFQGRSFAWGSAGHMVIAAEAYNQLSPEAKAQAFAVLQAHPNFQRWTNAYHPNPNLDLAGYVFIRSSTWPDEIRGNGGPYDHPEWHFIDYPLHPPSFLLVADPRPTNNVLYGIKQCEQTLNDTNANAELRAVSLAYLIHLVGDLHQPLHCESFFGDQFPNGDRGGNDFYVKPGEVPLRLHGIWDGLLGTSMNLQIQWKYALTLDAKFSRDSLPELTQHAKPLDWSLESRELAIEKGYLNGDLNGGTNENSAEPLSASYLTVAKVVAERQGALAGYRLTDEIQTYLKTTSYVPLLPKNTFVARTDLPKMIGTGEASKYYDESMVVTGKVVNVNIRSAIAILELDKPYPATPMTAVVFPSNWDQFGDLKRYQNHDVQITGTIIEYRNKPEIVLESPTEIKVVK